MSDMEVIISPRLAETFSSSQILMRSISRSWQFVQINIGLLSDMEVALFTDSQGRARRRFWSGNIVSLNQSV